MMGGMGLVTMFCSGFGMMIYIMGLFYFFLFFNLVFFVSGKWSAFGTTCWQVCWGLVSSLRPLYVVWRGTACANARCGAFSASPNYLSSPVASWSSMSQGRRRKSIQTARALHHSKVEETFNFFVPFFRHNIRKILPPGSWQCRRRFRFSLGKHKHEKIESQVGKRVPNAVRPVL